MTHPRRDASGAQGPPHLRGRATVRQALLDGLADGLRRHLPGAVGVVVKGVPICLLAAFAHLVLGVSMPVLWSWFA